MNFIQARWKAIAAFLSVLASNLYAYYQVNQNLTLKQWLLSLAASVIGGGIVHQVTNRGLDTQG